LAELWNNPARRTALGTQGLKRVRSVFSPAAFDSAHVQGLCRLSGALVVPLNASELCQ
jgi:hypothetical protein